MTVRPMPPLNPTKRLLRRMVQAAAVRDGMTILAWLDAHDIPHTTYYSKNDPTIYTLFKVCDAVGIKPSEFFRRLGK